MEIKNKRHYSISLISSWFIVCLILICHCLNPRFKFHFYDEEFTWDIFSYYMYLPFTFLYHDIGMVRQDIIKHLFDTYHISGTFYQAYQIDNGNFTPNYTCGLAILFSPFFLIGHLWAKIAGYPLDGFSFPYQFSVANGVLIYIIAGIFLLRKMLLLFFSDKISSISMLLIVLGTNYFQETFHNYMYPHAVLFSCYAALILNTYKWHLNPSLKNSFYIGLLCGLMILIRPSEIVCLLIPLLWGIWNKDSLKIKFDLVKKHASHLLAFCISALIVWIPQLIYWKIVTGSFVFYSYQKTEGFDFDSPHILNVLFSYKKSLFVYTPLLIVPLAGFFLLRNRIRYAYFPIVVFTLANFYLLSSWAAWWNGGSFGMRYFTESYAVLAIPLGLFMEKLLVIKKLYRYLMLLLIGFLVYVNLFQTWQYINWIIPEDGMTKAYYWRIFLKSKVSDEDRKLLSVKRTYGPVEEFHDSTDYTSHTIGYLDFEKINTIYFDKKQLDSTVCLSKPYSFKMPSGYEWGPLFKFRYDRLVPENSDHVWLRVSLNYFSYAPIAENITSVIFNMPHKKYNLKYKGFDFEKYPSTPGKWNSLTLYYLTPFPYSEKDNIEVYFWHRGNSDIYIDDVNIECLEKINNN